MYVRVGKRHTIRGEQLRCMGHRKWASRWDGHVEFQSPITIISPDGSKRTIPADAYRPHRKNGIHR